MSLSVRSVGDVIVLNPKGMLLGGKETDDLKERIVELDGTDNMKLLIDLGDVTFMSSMGLAVLFLAHAKYARRGAVVKLCRADKKIRHVFVLVKLTLVYGDNLCDTEEQAMADFGAPAAAGPA